MPSPKVWFITGASSGLGLSVLKHSLSKGDIAVATLRKPDMLSEFAAAYKDTQLLIVKLDVTNPDEIKSAFSIAQQKFGRIDVVYSNAGYATIAEVEGTEDKQARDMFEVNFWGSANVMRESVRFFRDVNKPAGGRFLQASSMAGVSAMSALGYYSATKFAIEGLVESVSKEVLPSWNIKMTILQIGSFRTGVTRGALVVLPVHPPYIGGSSILAREYLTGPQILKDMSDSDKGAREIYNIANDDEAALHVPLGLDALKVVGEKVEQAKEEIDKARKWAVDLKQDQ